MKVLLPVLLLGLCLMACVDEEEPVQHSKTFSYGYRDGEQVYFLIEAKVSRKRAPTWFIMPIERSPEIFFHELFLYRFQPATKKLEKLSSLRKDFPHGLSIKSSKFVRKGDLLIYAYQAASDVKRGLLYALGSWDLSQDAPGPLAPSSPVPAEDALNKEHFGLYKSPYTANPGIVPISELRRKILAGIDEAQWGLDWKKTADEGS